ncbi:hypothetical protein [Staphylococcus haemolyticus]|uniref:hypothetical protein n=1 Tax=Staphylococcus haemolyticus TaxID=1283 RepID=UPI0011A298FB|nr:hypothetical protein [Staphylococcus haemolyticus]
MNLKKYLQLEILREIKNTYLYLSIILSIISGSGIIYSIYSLNGPFDETHVSGLYATISVIAMSLFCVKTIAIDFHYQVSQLILTSKINRIKFIITKLTTTIFISLIFSIGCILLLETNSILNGFDFNFIDFVNVIIHHLLFMLFYSIVILLLSLFITKIATLFIINFILVMVLPSILQKLTAIPKIPEFIKILIEKSPFLTLPIHLPDLTLSVSNIIVIVFSVISLILITFILIPKKDF